MLFSGVWWDKINILEHIQPEAATSTPAWTRAPGPLELRSVCVRVEVLYKELLFLSYNNHGAMHEQPSAGGFC